MKKIVLSMFLLFTTILSAQIFTNLGLEKPPKRETKYVAPRKSKPKPKPTVSVGNNKNAEQLRKQREEEARLLKEQQEEERRFLRDQQEEEAHIALMEEELRNADDSFENKNYNRAAEIYIKYADDLDDVQQSNLAWMYISGNGIDQNFMKGQYYLEKSSEKGNAVAMNNLGWMYREGKGVQDYAKAIYWFEKSVENGVVDAMFNLGVIYYKGYGVDKDYVTAKYWLEKAANKGNSASMALLGFIYAELNDYANSRYWLEKQIQHSTNKDFNVISMELLSNYYKNGLGVTQNYDKAIYWAEKAIENGYDITKDSKQMNDLALMYYNYSVKDYTKARYWYEKAAVLGNKGAMLMLGEIYHKGYGVNIDLDRAKKYYEMSCEKKCEVTISKNSLKIK